MNGKMVVLANDKQIHIEGGVRYDSEIDRYVLAVSILRVLNIKTPEDLAKLVITAMVGSPKSETFTSTEIRIPRRKENNNETDAL